MELCGLGEPVSADRSYYQIVGKDLDKGVASQNVYGSWTHGCSDEKSELINHQFLCALPVSTFQFFPSTTCPS